MSRAPESDARARAVAFLRSLQDACAQRLVPVPGGHAVLDTRHPRLWDANLLRVETRTAPDADALLDAAEHQLGALDFRSIVTLDEAAGRPLLRRARRRRRARRPLRAARRRRGRAYRRLGFADAGLLPRFRKTL